MTQHPLYRRLSVIISLVLLAVAQPAPVVVAGSPPDPPVIASPIASGVSVDDVHMEIGAPFHDPDGDTHVATDWEIRRAEDEVVVWAGYASPQLIHAHFSDGRFLETVAVRTRRLNYKTVYTFRVRFQDSSGDWSAWSERRFSTTLYAELPPRQMQGVLTQPAPTWRSEGGTSVGLPAGARATLETASGAVLLTLTPAADGLVAIDGPRLSVAEPVRLVLRAPADAPLRLPDSRLEVVTDEPRRVTIQLPSLAVAAGAAHALWVSETGATFHGAVDQAYLHRDQVARDASLPWSAPPGYSLEAVGGAFHLPTSLAFVTAPRPEPGAPRLYVTELYFGVKVVTNDGHVFAFADNLLGFRPAPDFPGSGENGVIGLCLPPTGHDVYATTTFQDGAGRLRNKVVRIRSDDGLTALGVDDILRVEDERSFARSSHQIQQCAFGPDGKLYVSVADGPTPAASQDDATFNGKILRLNPDGSPPIDNPHYDPANPTAPISYQYTKGHRNAFGLTWRASDGQLYLSENGPNVDRLVKVVPGANYGWDGTDESMRTNALYTWPVAHWSPVGLAFAEGAAGGGLAPEDREALYVASAGPVYARGPQETGKAIQQFRLTADGRLLAEPRLFARYVGEGRGTIVDLKLQPDGLYFTDLYQDSGEGGAGAPGGRIWRLRSAGQAVAQADSPSGGAPFTVAFAGEVTGDRASAWRWDFGDGGVSGEQSPAHTFTQPGRYAVSLTATTTGGTAHEALVLITVTDVAGEAPEGVPTPLAPAPAASTIPFPETGQTLGGGFLSFWEANGGLSQFGYPLTPEAAVVNPTTGLPVLVQHFERARFEYHPDLAGTGTEIQLGLLGREATADRLAEEPFQPIPRPADGDWFEATGHSLGGAFRVRWETGGGAELYGLPISEPLVEADPDGSARQVQYFERVRMDLYPEAIGRADHVRIARLGTALAVRRPPAP